MAVNAPPGAAGTANLVVGDCVPDCTRKFPVTPAAFSRTTIQLVKLAVLTPALVSKPPLTMTSTALTALDSATSATTTTHFKAFKGCAATISADTRC